MRHCFAILLGALLTVASAYADVEVLPPDFVVFGKTASDYAADLYRWVYPLSTNTDYLFPKAGPLHDPRVYFLARPIFPGTRPGIPTYFVPDDAYVFFPIYAAVWDNVDTFPPLTIGQLRDTARAFVDAVTAVHATIDGVTLPNLLDHRAQSAVFSVYFANPDNFESLLQGHPFVGLDDPMVADGYFLMMKPLSPGIHDIRTGGTIGDPNGFTFERHYQIHSLTMPELLAHETDELATLVINSSLSTKGQGGLLATLNAAHRSFGSANLHAGLSQLGAFRQIVRAKISRDNPTLAAQLSEAAQRIIDRAATGAK